MYSAFVADHVDGRHLGMLLKQKEVDPYIAFSMKNDEEEAESIPLEFISVCGDGSCSCCKCFLHLANGSSASEFLAGGAESHLQLQRRLLASVSHEMATVVPHSLGLQDQTTKRVHQIPK